MSTTPRETSFQVVVVGAGPVGLALAIDLGQRGIRTLIVDRLAEASGYPKMERVNPRTMEQFRRLGLVGAVRAAGLPAELPMDVFVTDTLATPPLVCHPQASVKELVERTAATNDGTMPAEPYQLISQYTLEPLLRKAVREIDSVTVRFGEEVVGFDEREDSVRVDIRTEDGTVETAVAPYLVACDGGSSGIRDALGIKLVGEPNLLDIYQALFYSADLYERIPIGKGRHYHFLDEYNSFLIVQDDTQHFTMHTQLEDASQIKERFESRVGFDVDYEVQFVGAWTMRSMLAESYGTKRIFLAGDAAHLMNPTAGLGMNTGIGDAIDIGWKLNAVLSGWAPEELLGTYELERRPVGAANVAYSRARFDARATWRSEITPEALADPAGRRRIGELADANEANAGDMEGIELGYSYAGSPLFDGTGSAAPEPVAAGGGIRRPYTPTATPGVRLPHVWVQPGTASQDVIPQGVFSLVCADGPGDVADAFRAAFADAGVPLEIVDAPSAAARTVWGAGHVLVRPDLHVVWRGDKAPADAARIARRSVGGLLPQ